MADYLLSLHPKQPFRLAPALHFIRLSPAGKGSSTVLTGGRLAHTALIDGRTVVFTIHSEGDEGDQETLACEIEALEEGEKIDNSLRRSAVSYLDNYLSLSEDLLGFYALAGKDKRFASTVLERLYGYHPVKFPTPLESAVWAVLSQATPQVLARKLLLSLCLKYGRAAQADGVELVAFPDPQTLIDAPKGELRDLIASERKARTIQMAAQAFAAVDPAWLRDTPSEYVESWLREIPGIGAWSAMLILIRGLGRMDCVTVDSLAATEPFLTAAQRVYGARFDSIRLAKMVERYGPYAGYWLHYLRAGAAR